MIAFAQNSGRTISTDQGPTMNWALARYIWFFLTLQSQRVKFLCLTLRHSDSGVRWGILCKSLCCEWHYLEGLYISCGCRLPRSRSPDCARRSCWLYCGNNYPLFPALVITTMVFRAPFLFETSLFSSVLLLLLTTMLCMVELLLTLLVLLPPNILQFFNLQLFSSSIRL